MRTKTIEIKRCPDPLQTYGSVKTKRALIPDRSSHSLLRGSLSVCVLVRVPESVCVCRQILGGDPILKKFLQKLIK